MILRLLGFTHYIRSGRSKVACSNFRSQPIRTVYRVLALFDTTVHYCLKLAIPRYLGATIVCDRWIYDVIVDISLNTRDPAFCSSLPGRVMTLLASKADFVVMLDASDSKLNSRRPDARFDPLIDERRRLYRLLADRYAVPIFLSNSMNQRTAAYEEIMTHFANQLSSPREKIYGIGYNDHNALVRYLLRKRVFAALSNWLFQGMLIMCPSELCYRLGSELLLAILIYYAIVHSLGESGALIFCLLIAHTANWILNGNFIGTQKFFGMKYDQTKVANFLIKLKAGHQLLRSGIAMIAAFGSWSRTGKLTEHSDLDIRIIRKPGLLNWLKANVFASLMRLTAVRYVVPLDLYVLDRRDQVYEHIRKEERPVMIYGPEEQ
ncbi:MAG: nucleotidyltransferase domain-containing protein [Candidatus Bathyarchaeia archaeon]